jgi:very-short-patch-repair endonuclease
MTDKPRDHWRSTIPMQARARELRGEMTPAERKVWQRIRNGQLEGMHFRRQYAVGRFIVDFLCAKSRLVIEIDGDTHAGQVEYDEERTRWLEEQKHYCVIRFANDEVMRNVEGVVEAIREALKGQKPPP